MKKLLLLMLILFGIQNTSAQVLLSEDFESLPVGAVGTDATGTIATNNYFTLSTNYDLDPLAPTTATNASAANFQIVPTDVHGNVLQIEGTNGDRGRRNMWQDGLAGQWLFREPGNDIIEVEFDFFTGTPGESANTKGLYIYDATTTSTALKILGGFVFNTKTLVLQGIAYFTSPTAPIANYGFFLGAAATNITLEANTWVRLGVSFNKATGQVIWKGPTFNGQVTGAAVDLDPDKIAFVSRSGSAAAIVTPPTPAIVNTASSTEGLFDNVLVTATNTDTLLGVEDVSATIISYSIYPNPANNTITVSSIENNTINAIAISDLNGRKIKNQIFDGIATIEMNISDLASGMYLISITSENGTSIQKIMKN